MGIKLLWTGLTIATVLDGFIPESKVVGGVIMVIGCILMWLDK